jgi:H+/Cl- antiporter ClcA
MNLQVTQTIKNYFNASSYKIRILTGSLFAAIVADGVITRYLVHNGLAQEGNPFMQYWVAEDKLLTLKICGGLIAALYLWSIYRRHPRLSIVFTSILLTGYIFIVGWNLHILL